MKGGGGGGNDNIKHVYFECNTDYTRILGGGGVKDITKHVYFECNTDYTRLLRGLRLLGGGGGLRISLNMYILNVTLITQG